MHDGQTFDPLSDEHLHERYREVLDEIYGRVTIGELSWSASDALEQLDPVAFRCGYVDWESAELEAGTIVESFWLFGWNLPGYLPDTEPTPVAEWSDAWDALRDEIEAHGDELEDRGMVTAAEEIRTWLESAAPTPDRPFSAIIGDYCFFISAGE